MEGGREREGGRGGGREGGREGGSEGEREGGREGRREGERDGGSEGRVREGEREGVREELTYILVRGMSWVQIPPECIYMYNIMHIRDLLQGVMQTHFCLHK